MSRTIRRKNSFYRDRCNKEHGMWVTCTGKDSTFDQTLKDTIENTKNIGHKYLDVPEGTKSFEVAKHEYHGDTARNYGYSIPSDFLNTFATRPDRAKNRANCKKMTLDPEFWYEADLGETSSSKGVAWIYD